MEILILILVLAINFLFVRSIGLKEGEEAMKKPTYKTETQRSENKYASTFID